MTGELPTVANGLDVGLLTAALLLGMRHGVDWDHIAAITDITASQQTSRRGVWLGSVYALGHAAVVFVLGVAAILLGERLSPSVDAVMGRTVGVTLVVLAVYVGYSMVRYGREFRLQSRWMLVISTARRLHRWVTKRMGPNGMGVLTHEHPHGQPMPSTTSPRRRFHPFMGNTFTLTATTMRSLPPTEPGRR